MAVQTPNHRSKRRAVVDHHRAVPNAPHKLRELLVSVAPVKVVGYAQKHLEPYKLMQTGQPTVIGASKTF
ncbi:MAG: hypothetical protein JWN34_3146 [Bryobacterales bacterium]|nr:hypothetical protein [Bryobacterales bacterium]